MWEPFHVDLGPQPIHPCIIYSPAVTCEIIQLLPNFCANKCGSSSMIVDPSAHPQHMNGLKHLLYAWSGCGNHSMWVWGLIQQAQARKLKRKLAYHGENCRISIK